MSLIGFVMLMASIIYGGDIAASMFGGWISYTSFDREWARTERANRSLVELLQMDWPGLSVHRVAPPDGLRLWCRYDAMLFDAATIEAVLGWFGRAVEAVGRRSLTFYLLQSIVLAPLMSAWGLGVGAHVNSLAAALIATAVGLFVAIPAVCGYNVFRAKLAHIEGVCINFAGQMLNRLQHEAPQHADGIAFSEER